MRRHRQLRIDGQLAQATAAPAATRVEEAFRASEPSVSMMPLQILSRFEDSTTSLDIEENTRRVIVGIAVGVGVNATAAAAAAVCRGLGNDKRPQLAATA